MTIFSILKYYYWITLFNGSILNTKSNWDKKVIECIFYDIVSAENIFLVRNNTLKSVNIILCILNWCNLVYLDFNSLKLTHSLKKNETKFLASN